MIATATIVAGFAIAAFAATHRASRDAALFDEASLLMDRTRELDAIRWQLTQAGVEPSRLRAARDTARDPEEVRRLDELLACSAVAACRSEMPPLLDAVQQRHHQLLKGEMAAAHEVQARDRAFAVVGGVLVLCGSLLAAWPRQQLVQPAIEGESAGLDERDQHLRVRLEELYALRMRTLESDRFSAYGEVAAGLSHGLKTPLASIRAATELALTKLGFDHPVAAQLEDTLEEIDSLVEQVRRFLQASGAGAPQPTQVALGELVGVLERAYASDAAGRSVIWRSEIEDGVASVVADPALLEMALRNLVENGLAAAPPGTTLSVVARSTQAPSRAGLDQLPPAAGSWVEVAIVDEGAGVPDILVAGGRRDSDKAGGTGIGLAIARRIALRHGGSLEIERRIPRGSAVHLRLPVGPPEPG